jgi:hypothetical protein
MLRLERSHSLKPGRGGRSTKNRRAVSGHGQVKEVT